MADLAEKRVFAGRSGATDLVIATASGVAVVSISGGRVGEYGLAKRCSPSDVAVPAATGNGPAYRLAVATDADVLLAGAATVAALEPSGFGPATAVSSLDGRPIAGAAGGHIGVHDGTGWTTVGTLSAPPTALDGDLVGTEDGVYRLVDGSLEAAGLTGVTDVTHAAGVPLAATDDGLYALGNGWLDVLPGRFRIVAGAPDGRAHAATASACFERTDTGWQPVDLPVDGPVGAVAYGVGTYVITTDGDVVVEGPDGWETQALGLEGVAAAAVL